MFALTRETPPVYSTLQEAFLEEPPGDPHACKIVITNPPLTLGSLLAGILKRLLVFLGQSATLEVDMLCGFRHGDDLREHRTT